MIARFSQQVCPGCLVVGAYVFGSQVLRIYTSEAEVIQCGLQILSITNCSLFSLRYYGSDTGGFAWHGTFGSTHDSLCDRYSGDPGSVDLCVLSTQPVAGFPVCFLSGLLDRNYTDAGSMLLFRKKRMYPAYGE